MLRPWMVATVITSILAPFITHYTVENRLHRYERNSDEISKGMSAALSSAWLPHVQSLVLVVLYSGIVSTLGMYGKVPNRQDDLSIAIWSIAAAPYTYGALRTYTRTDFQHYYWLWVQKIFRFGNSFVGNFPPDFSFLNHQCGICTFGRYMGLALPIFLLVRAGLLFNLNRVNISVAIKDKIKLANFVIAICQRIMKEIFS